MNYFLRTSVVFFIGTVVVGAASQQPPVDAVVAALRMFGADHIGRFAFQQKRVERRPDRALVVLSFAEKRGRVEADGEYEEITCEARYSNYRRFETTAKIIK